MTESLASYDGNGLMIGRKVCRCRRCHWTKESKGHECYYFAYMDENGNMTPASVTPDGFCA